jgi:uncharacterized repeat protein (TIGR03803 family)
MITSHIAFTQSCSAARRQGALALGVLLCALGLGLAANAQESAPVPQGKEMVLHNFVNAPHAVFPGAGASRLAARPQESAPVPDAQEVVLHNFASPPNGAYPAWGVIRDPAGNLYGTTNGAYSDIGGGGTNDSGVVFKIDTAGNETVLYSFTGGADGNSPNSLIRDSAGNLFGTTTYGGGASGAGVVFKVDTSGHESVLYSFTGAADGGNPFGGVVRDSAGNLYGVTDSGGNGDGVVFKVDPTGHETVLYSFTGGADGGNPNPVILDSAGNLYGTTYSGGGASGAGVVFKVDPTGHETVLYSFTGGNDGGASEAGVIRDSAGNLYGTTSAGGTSNAGVVFKVDRSGHETVLYSFTGAADGGNPTAGVIRDSAGNLYGTTSSGGTEGLGVVFKVDTSGNETVLDTFVRGRHGNQPDFAGVIRDSAGSLYGTVAFGGSGGQGAVYKLDSSGAETVLYAFPSATDGQYSYNNGVIFEWAGQLYGATFYGGKAGAGVVYQLDEHDNETVLASFDLSTANGFGQPTGGVIRDWQGNLYGTTFIGQAYAGYGYGVVYKVDTTGHLTLLHNFTNGADGGDPYGGVIRDWQGNLYGTTSGGGPSGAGNVFKIDTSGHLTVLYSFTGAADGGYPYGGLVRDWQGNLYGTTNGGGASSAGVVFKVDPSGHETALYSFTGEADGGYPLAGVIFDSKGNLYGTTNGGGASNEGVVFKVDPSGHETVLHSFSGGTDGGYPLWVTLVHDCAGNLYGTTADGGTANTGVVFKIDPSGHETVLHSFTGGADGGNPYVGVVLGPEGKLYGTTAFGGQTNAGVVFEVNAWSWSNAASPPAHPYCRE